MENILQSSMAEESSTSALVALIASNLMLILMLAA
jgi:hypothetical protein